MTLIRFGLSLGRVLLWALLIIFLLIAIALAVFRFAPQSYLALTNKFTPYSIDAKELKTELLPAVLTANNLTVKDQNANELLQSGQLLLKVDWPGLLSKKHNFWYGEINNARIDLPAIQTAIQTIAAEQQTSEKVADTDQSPQQPINAHHILSLLNFKITNTELILDEQTRLNLNSLVTNISETQHTRAEDVTQNIDIRLSYTSPKNEDQAKDENKQLTITGRLESRYENGVSLLSLDLDSLNLDEYLGSDSQTSEKVNEQAESTTPSPIDWSFLEQIKPTQISVSSDLIRFQGNTFKSALLQSTIDQNLSIDTLTATIDWNLADDLYFRDTINIAGQFAPDKNGDIETQLKLTATDSTWALNGLINPVAPLNSAIKINTSAISLPLFEQDGSVSSLVTEQAQWLPVSAAIESKKDDSSEDALQLNISKITAGKSDLNGQLMISHFSNPQQKPKLEVTINSNQIHYSPSSNTASEDTSNEDNLNAEKSVSEQDLVFSPQNIDWSWMNSVDLNANINIKSLKVDELVLSDINLPITLNAEQGLNIPKFNALLGSGDIASSISITPTDGGQVDIALNTKANNIKLDELHLLDKETINGGESQLTLSWQSTGQSLADLANNLNGSSLLKIEQAQIGNDAFEIIGSDLITELISKLNPFLKSDPTTTLKCAVINLPITQGKIKVDKSIAIETSKMAIVANGYINLGKETLKLGIEPKATSGIGLDIGTIVKFMELGGKLNNPKPIVGASGLLKSGIAVGAALSTGGTSMLADGLLSRVTAGTACKRALKNSPD